MWLRVMVNREAKGITEQLAKEMTEDKQILKHPQLREKKQMGENRNQVRSGENESCVSV